MMKVVIYTCVYNGEETLPNTIESVLRQSYGSFEYHIEDNGSTDGTRAVIQDYADRDSRIILHARPKNHVQTKEPSPVVTFVPPESEYFTNIDGDDWWEPDYLERLLAFAETNRLDIACTGTLMHNLATGDKSTRQLPRQLLLDRKQLMAGFPYYHAFFRTIWGKLIRTELVKKIHMPDIENIYPYGADTVYSFQLLRHAKRVGIDNSVLHHYRIAQKSVSTQYHPGRFQSDVYLYNDAVDFLSGFGAISPQNRQFLQVVYSNALLDTTGVIQNSILPPKDKLREYRAVAVHPLTLAAYRECGDESAERSRQNLLVRALEAGMAVGKQDDEDLRIIMQTILPRCGPSVSSDNVRLFAENPALLQALFRDDADTIMDYLLGQMENGQSGKRYTIPEMIQALAVNKPLLCQISDGVFLRKYASIYRNVWQGKHTDALDEMAGLLLEGKVDGGQDTFLQLFTSLAAVENQASVFIFGKIQLAQLYLKQQRLAECRAIVEELQAMGIENEDMDALRNGLEDRR